MLDRFCARPMTIWLVTAVALSLFDAAYWLAGVAPSPLAEFLHRCVWAFAILAWIDTDSRRQGGPPIYDFGLYMAGGGFVSLAWYVFWSRGRRGFWVLLGMAALVMLQGFLFSTARGLPA